VEALAEAASLIDEDDAAETLDSLAADPARARAVVAFLLTEEALPAPPAPAGELDVEGLSLRDELAEAEHEVAAFIHRLHWGSTPHDTEPGDGSDCHECYADAERLLDLIVSAVYSSAADAPEGRS
jgi:hypothetical protein